MDCNMATLLNISLLIILAVASVATLLGNGFIIVVNTQCWLQTRKFLPNDLLLTCLGIFRCFLQSAALLGQYIYVRYPMDFMCSYVWKAAGVLWMYFNISNFSCTTCLTVFYLVKVITFAHPLFLWLKPRIDRFVPRMLAMSLIILVLCSPPLVLDFWRMKTSCNLTRNLTANTSQTEASLIVILNPLHFGFSAINFGICLTASVLLIVSLWRHTRNLKKNGIGTKDLSTQAHIKVIKQLILFLFLYILYYVTMIIALHDILRFGDERLSSDIVLSLYPSAHSMILIWTNPKLKGAFARILPCKERSSVKHLPRK